MKKFYFVGCSMTYGDDLTTPAETAWPALVAKHYDVNFSNDAVSGGANDRIVYRTIKNSDLYDKFYIAWSRTHRFTRYDPKNNFEVSFNTRLNNSIYRNKYEFLEYGKLHYAYWVNELYQFKHWLQQIIFLQNYLSKKNKQYVMISALDNKEKSFDVDWKNFNDSVKNLLCIDLMDDQQLLDEHNEIQQYMNEIDLSKFLNWKSATLADMTKSFPSGPTNHPLEEGHVAMAKFLIDNDPYI